MIPLIRAGAILPFVRWMQANNRPVEDSLSAVDLGYLLKGGPNLPIPLVAAVAFVRAAKQAGVQRFAVVSALGASVRSPGFYNRVKGEMEEALAGLGFASLVIARPSLLAGDRTALGQPGRPGERLAQMLTAPLAPLIPKGWRPIDAATVARALRRAVAEARPGVRTVESAELQELGA